MKKTVLTILAVMLAGCVWTPVCYAKEAENITMNVFPFEKDLAIHFEGDDEESEEDILPPSDEEYVMGSVTLPWFAQEEGKIVTKTIINQSISFKKTAATKAVAAVSLKASAGTTRLKVNIRLQKKVGSAYKSIGKATTHQANKRTISCRTTFSVEKNSVYRI